MALGALAWTLQDADRAERLLSLTGLSADELRNNLSDGAVLSAVLDFLCNHEPDLLRAADALEIEPRELVAAREELNR